MNEVFITRIAKFLPNDPVANAEMEDILGMVNDRPSRTRSIVLRQSGIKTRHYAIDKNRTITHNNAQLTARAIQSLADEHFSIDDIELLCCGTATPDQMIPSHASMVHGVLKNRPLEINSPSGVCCSGMQAYKYGYLSVRAGETKNAVCTGSETASFSSSAHKFVAVSEASQSSREPTPLAFERDFLRWMLSDGAGALLMENRPRGPISLRIEWVDSMSFANELAVCMFGGCARQDDGTVRSFHTYDYETVRERALTTLQQDVRLLNDNIIAYAVQSLEIASERRGCSPKDVDYFLPHLSSEYFRKPLAEQMERAGIGLPQERWFTNLTRVGNVGSASAYLALEDLFHSGRLEQGQRIWLAVPESGRFMYMNALMTVC